MRSLCLPGAAELGQVSAPPREPGTLERILSNVEAAKEQVAAERQAAEEATCSAEQVWGCAAAVCGMAEGQGAAVWVHA